MNRLKEASATHGWAFFAHNQYAGKGQQGKKWISAPGENIVISVIFDTSNLPLTLQPLFNMMIAVACHRFLSNYTGADETFIKWPNDIYWRDRKAGGILIESVIKGNIWQYAVAGIGINVNQTQFPDLSKRPVSIKQITGKEHIPVQLAKELCDCINESYEQLQQSEFDIIHNYYNRHLFKKNELVKFRQEQTFFECVVEGVNQKGELLVTGTKKAAFAFHEIEWII